MHPNRIIISILSIALVAAIVYISVITLDRNTLNTKIESVESKQAVAQAQLDVFRNKLASAQSELKSTQVALASTQSDLDSTKQTLTAKQIELTATKQALGSIDTDIASMKSELDSIKKTLASTQAALEDSEGTIELYKHTLGINVYSGVQPPYDKGRLGQVDLVNRSTATNPTWSELMAFLRADPTDDEYYEENQFICGDFAEMLHNNAEAAKIKSAFVAVFFKDKEIGHALNAFKTRDKGLVYVDCTGQTSAQATQDLNASVIYPRGLTEYDCQ